MTAIASELKELELLQEKIIASKERGEQVMRVFWQITGAFAFICFAWLFFLPKINPDINNLPFFVIGIFGFVAIIVLVTGDVFFFNKTFEWQDNLESRLSVLASQTLGMNAAAISLRRSSFKEAHYVLKVTLEQTPIEDEKIEADSQPIQLTFRLNACTLTEAFELLEAHKSDFTQINVKK